MVATALKKYWLLILILLAAAFLRLYRIADYMTFLGDEGRDVLVVKRIIVDHKFTLLGPTASVGGFFLGPFYYYLMIPFLWLWRLNPVGPAVMVALFGIATGWLVYKVGKDFFNHRVGLIAAGLYCVSPLIISYSRSSWNPNLMPFFSLLIIWLTWKIVTTNKPRWLLILGFLFGLAIQLHYLTTFLIVIIGVYLLIYYRRWRYYPLVLIGFVIGWSPFLLFELRHGFPNFQTLYRFLVYGNETGLVANKFFPIISDVFVRLFTRLVTNNYRYLGLLLLIGSLWIIIKGWVKSKKVYSLIGLWLFLGVILFGFYQKGIYDYYFGFIFPLPFLLTAALLDKIKIRWVSGGLLAILVLINLKGIPFRYPPNRQLNQVRQIAKVVFDQAGNQPFNFALVTNSNSDHAYRYFLEIWGDQPITIQNSQADPQRKTVTNQLFVVCEMVPCAPLGHSLWEIAGFGRAEIANQWEAPAGLQVYKLIHYKGE